MIRTSELRKRFLEFFRDRGHEVVPSSSLVPANDPTLLFTNAGMVQFKDIFLGRETRDYKRAVTAQRCVRVGGKHNDLENVGYTARHHTFFEMLGNFSFNDYFKEDAIHFAWEFLVRVLKLPPERLWITVFEEDNEAVDIWLDAIGVSPERFARIGAKDNFWQMGDTGPCGPCSEIFYDHGPEVAGGPPGTPEADGDRYVEIWNLVFMQYDRSADGTLATLPKPCVDTGMGLERLAAVMQGVHSNYEIDLFTNLMRVGAELAGTEDLSNNSLRVLADHIRSCAFLIADGVLPSNEGRGYVLRRLIRRAARHGYKLGIREPFFFKLVEPLIKEMGEAYAELIKSREQIKDALYLEEGRFNVTLAQGMSILEEELKSLRGRLIPGETIFRLYDTYGFPVDLTADIARERDFAIDQEGFDRAMEAQRKRARAASHFSVDLLSPVSVDEATEFTGYEHLEEEGTVLGIYRNGTPVPDLEAGQESVVVLDRTPFYAESGGQVGDQGTLTGEAGAFKVTDAQKQGAAITHIGEMISGSLGVGDKVAARVDADRRQATALNHSATHLLHAALRQVLGDHVQQRGSLVEPQRLRFDFSHPQPMSSAELSTVERLVNDRIRLNQPAQAKEMSMQDALASGALAFFGEKYGEAVRVLSIGDFSVELCGGTHVSRAGDIGVFKIVAETGIASGVRRIEALTGKAALEWMRENEEKLSAVAQMVKAGQEDVAAKVGQLVERARSLEKELIQLKAKLARQAGDDVAQAAIEIDGVKVVAARLEGADSKILRETVDRLKSKLGSVAVVLGTVDGTKVRLVAGVSKDQTQWLKAGDLVNSVAKQVGGRGGGRPDFAQAGGDKPAELDKALDRVADWVREQLATQSTEVAN